MRKNLAMFYKLFFLTFFTNQLGLEI